jgi:hypothetical protein
MSRSVSTALLALAFPAVLAAQEKLPTLDAVRDEVQGTEVYLQGYIGNGLVIGDDEAISFVAPDRIAYDVVFDAGREARKALAGCTFETFTGGTPCKVAGYGELEWDGPRLRVILYSIETLAPPAKMDPAP